MTATTSRPSLPRIDSGPLAPPSFSGHDKRDDWSEIESILASPTPSQGPAKAISKRTAANVILSSFVASVALASLLAAAFWLRQENCGLQSSCPARTANASSSPSLVQGRSVGLDETRRK